MFSEPNLFLGTARHPELFFFFFFYWRRKVEAGPVGYHCPGLNCKNWKQFLFGVFLFFRSFIFFYLCCELSLGRLQI